MANFPWICFLLADLAMVIILINAVLLLIHVFCSSQRSGLGKVRLQGGFIVSPVVPI